MIHLFEAYHRNAGLTFKIHRFMSILITILKLLSTGGNLIQPIVQILFNQHLNEDF